MVLIDPLGDPFGLSFAGIGERLGVGSIWQTKIRVMSRVFDEDCDRLIADVLEDATCVPWIQLTVGEDYVRHLHEVTLRYASTEVVKCPVVLGHLTICSIALGRVLLFIPSSCWEHGCSGVGSEWHGHLIAGLDSPAIVIESSTLRD